MLICPIQHVLSSFLFHRKFPVFASTFFSYPCETSSLTHKRKKRGIDEDDNEDEDDKDDNALSKIANAGLGLRLSTYGTQELQLGDFRKK